MPEAQPQPARPPLLSTLAHKAPVMVGGETRLAQALATMHERQVGALVVVDAAGAARGILTRDDILERVTLARVPLDAPISQVMTHPVHTLDASDTAQAAVLMMLQHGIGHVPLTEHGRVVGIVSERDLCTVPLFSIKHVGSAIRKANDVEALRLVAEDIRRFARNLLGQGIGARRLTELISHLHDVLTERLVRIVADRHGVDLQHACWLAFGSEGRSEQTIATDQDNGLVFESDSPQRDRPRWLAFARGVNEALDACGYPLCRGNVMASNPHCCLTSAEWCARFNHWIEHGAPGDLLNASIYFDLRPLAGRIELALPLQALVHGHGASVPRFVKQLAENALTRRPPLSWLGRLGARNVEGHAVVDLKLHGTAIFVDAARLYALALGVAQTNTRSRFEAIAPMLKIEPRESESWTSAFEFLQMLRLQAQIGPDGAAPNQRPNLIDVAALNDMDREVLKDCLRVARRLQQRIELDYQR